MHWHWIHISMRLAWDSSIHLLNPSLAPPQLFATYFYAQYVPKSWRSPGTWLQIFHVTILTVIVLLLDDIHVWLIEGDTIIQSVDFQLVYEDLPPPWDLWAATHLGFYPWKVLLLLLWQQYILVSMDTMYTGWSSNLRNKFIILRDFT